MKHSQHAMQFVFLAAAAVVSAAFFSITFDIIIWLGSEQQQKTSPHINSLVPITGLITNILGCHHSLRFCHWFISSFSFPTLIPYIFVTYVFCCGCCRCRLDFDLVGGIRFFFSIGISSVCAISFLLKQITANKLSVKSFVFMALSSF